MLRNFKRFGSKLKYFVYFIFTNDSKVKLVIMKTEYLFSLRIASPHWDFVLCRGCDDKYTSSLDSHHDTQIRNNTLWIIQNVVLCGNPTLYTLSYSQYKVEGSISRLVFCSIKIQEKYSKMFFFKV